MINEPTLLDVDIFFKDGKNITFKIFLSQLKDVMSHINSQDRGFISLKCPDGSNIAVNKESISHLRTSPSPIDNLDIRGIVSLRKLVK